MNSSEFLRFLQARTSVRDYTGEPLAPEQIDFILASARTAPSAGNREAWDVVVVTDADLRAELARAAYEQAHVGDAPAVFVVCANYVRSMSKYGERGILYAIQDATIACTYMMLAAHALGLASCWTGAFEEDDVREITQIPQHIRPVALLVVGSGRVSSEHTERMPLGEHTHRETW